MPEQGHSLVGTVLNDRYKVVRQIGKGAMGTVYEALHAAVGRRLAIKVLSRGCNTPHTRERFFHEARAAGAINHQHIVPVLDFGFVDSGEPYIVMEYVEGEPLEAHIEQRAPLPPGDAVEICSQVLSALEVIHGAGLVHRDVKPANIMLMKVRRPKIFAKLLDFGVARALHAAWQRPELTRVNEILGTPAYFAPEQAAGGEADPRWDLWAAGVILYEMLSGDLPFRLESMPQVMSDLANCRLVPLGRRNPNLPGWVYEVVERAHHPVLSLRFQSATAFLQALETKRAFDEEVDAQTVPFVRVELHTPPPEILGQLSGSGPRGSGRRRRATDEEISIEERIERADRPEPVPTRRSSPDDALAESTSDVEPLPPERSRPRARSTGGGRRSFGVWIPVVLSVLLLAAAAIVIYLALVP